MGTVGTTRAEWLACGPACGYSRYMPKSGRPAEREPIEGGYRCTECGHGEKLWAYAGANVCGPLSPDGESLDEHEAVEEWGIYEDSICCSEHGYALERFVGGKWCRWWACPKCRGGGVIRYGGTYDRPYTAKRTEETPFPVRPIRAGDPGETHEGWLPAGEFAALAVDS